MTPPEYLFLSTLLLNKHATPYKISTLPTRPIAEHKKNLEPGGRKSYSHTTRDVHPIPTSKLGACGLIKNVIHAEEGNVGLAAKAWSGKEVSVLDTLRKRQHWKAIELTQAAGPSEPLENLSVNSKFERSGTSEDLDEAISQLRQAIKVATQKPARASCHDKLGSLLREKYMRTGMLDHLEEAVRSGQEAILAECSTSTRSQYLSNLGVSLCSRFEDAGEIRDLEDAIAKGREAFAEIPSDHPSRDLCLNNLALTLVTLSTTTRGTTEELEEAIGFGRKVIDASCSGDPRLALYLSNLSVWLRKKYERTRAKHDLDEAILSGLKAINATPPDHPDKARGFKSLGVMFGLKFRMTKNTEDFKKCVYFSRRAIRLSFPAHLDAELYLDVLAGLSEKCRTHNLDIDEVLDSVLEALNIILPQCPHKTPLRDVQESSDGGRFNKGKVLKLREASPRHQQADHMANLYKHQPLCSPRAIRLVKLEPASKGPALRCELIELSLDNLPQYEAISYTWDSQQPSWHILCEESRLPITKNRRDILYRLRHRTQTRMLWIDVVCIYFHRTVMKDLRTVRFEPQFFVGINCAHLASHLVLCF